jgi:hypothetical protein
MKENLLKKIEQRVIPHRYHECLAKVHSRSVFNLVTA